jgi:predicted MFS family arabinose efflux permease
VGWGGVVAGESMAQVAIGVLAYRVGGVGGLGSLVALQVLPSAVLAPWLALLGDDVRRERLMLACDAVRFGLALAAALVAAAGARGWALYPIAIGFAVAQSTFNPARRSIVPLLVGAPSELTAASVVTTSVQAVCQAVGPAVAGLAIAISGPAAALVVASVCFLVAIRVDFALPDTAGLTQRPDAARPTVSAAVSAALADSRLRLVLGLFAAKNLGRGALNVLIVVTPIELLGLGGGAVGWLTAAIGAGGIVGGLVAATLVTRRRLAAPMAGGLALWSIALLAIAGLPRTWVAVAALVVLGIGNTICDAAGYSLISRSTRDDLLVRVYGVHESVRAASIALGAVVAASVVAAGGVRTALVAIGVLLLAAAVAGLALRGLDRAVTVDAGWIDLLRGVPLLGWLPPVGLERLATHLEVREFEPGAVLLAEGEPGDVAYVIEDGTAAVSIRGEPVATVGPGDLVGEIALLRRSPRTATVTAAGRLRVLALSQTEFMVAATGSPDARAAGADLVAERLQRGA